MNRWLLVLLLVTAGFASAEPSQVLPMPKSLQQESLPWFAARDGADGEQPFTRSTLEKFITPEIQRVALIYFATWCVPCRHGILRLREKSKDLENHHIAVVLINVGEREPEKIKDWTQKFVAASWPVVLDYFGRLTEGFGLIKTGETLPLPRTLLLDAHLKPLFLIGSEGDDWPEILWR